MYQQANELQQLATRVGMGDAGAHAVLRDQFERHLVHIVRRTVRTGKGTSALSERILAEVHRAAPGGWEFDTAERERVIQQVTQRLCDSMMDRLQPVPADGWTIKETVRC